MVGFVSRAIDIMFFFFIALMFVVVMTDLSVQLVCIARAASIQHLDMHLNEPECEHSSSVFSVSVNFLFLVYEAVVTTEDRYTSWGNS